MEPEHQDPVNNSQQPIGSSTAASSPVAGFWLLNVTDGPRQKGDKKISSSFSFFDNASTLEEAKDEARAFGQHAAARTPMLFAKVALFAPYATVLAKMAASASEDPTGRLQWLGAGYSMLPTSYVAVYTTIFTLITAIVSPVLGAAIDYSDQRRNCVAVFGFISAVSSMLMAFCWPSTWWLAGILAIISGLGYEASTVLMNGFLADMTVAVNNVQRSRVSRNAVAMGNGAQIAVVGVLAALILSFSVPKFSVQGGAFDSTNDASEWMLRSANGTELGQCAPETCILQMDHLARWIVLDVSAHEDRVTGGYGLVLHQSIPLMNGAKEYRVFANAWIASDVIPGENAAPVRAQIGFVYLAAEGRVIGETFSANSSAASGGRSSDGYRFLAAAVNDGEIPVNTEFVKVELRLSGPGRVRVKEICTFRSPDLWVPFAMFITGVWFAVFVGLSYRNLHHRKAARDLPASARSYATAGFSRLFRTLGRSPEYPYLLRFLVSKSMHSAGSGTIAAVMGLFLSEVLGFSVGLIGALLLGVQLIGIFGALAFHKLGQHIGFSRSLSCSYFSLVVGILLLYCLLEDSSSFIYVLIVFPILGLSAGGSVSLGRSVFSTLVPLGQESEFFGLYMFSHLCLGWLGGLSFVVANEAFGDIHAAMLVQTVLILPAACIQMSIPEQERSTTT